MLALHDAFLPATVNLQEPDPELDLDYIPNQGRALQVDYAMSDSLASAATTPVWCSSVGRDEDELYTQ